MFFSRAVFASLLAASFANAELVLPFDALGKKDNKGKDNKHVFDTTVYFETSKDLDFTPEQISLIDDAVIASCNEVHDTKKFLMDSLETTDVEHYKIETITKSQGLRASWWYNEFYGASMHSRGGFYCYMCGPDDDRRALLEVASGKGKVRAWEAVLCDTLSQYDDFEHIQACKIDVDVKKEVAEE